MAALATAVGAPLTTRVDGIQRHTARQRRCQRVTDSPVTARRRRQRHRSTPIPTVQVCAAIVCTAKARGHIFRSRCSLLQHPTTRCPHRSSKLLPPSPAHVHRIPCHWSDCQSPPVTCRRHCSARYPMCSACIQPRNSLRSVTSNPGNRQLPILRRNRHHRCAQLCTRHRHHEGLRRTRRAITHCDSDSRRARSHRCHRHLARINQIGQRGRSHRRHRRITRSRLVLQRIARIRIRGIHIHHADSCRRSPSCW